MSAIITVPEEATSFVAQFGIDLQDIELAKERFANVDATTPEGMKEAILGRALFRDTRTGIENNRVKLKAAPLEEGRKIDAAAKAFTSLVEPHEKALDAKIKAEELKKTNEKKAREEQQRLAQEQMERQRREAEEREIAKQRAELERERAQFAAEQKARQEAEDKERAERREAEEKARIEREEAERARVAKRARVLELLGRLHNTGIAGLSFEDTCSTSEDLSREPREPWAGTPLASLEAVVAAKELQAKELRAAEQRRKQAEDDERAAEEKRFAEERESQRVEAARLAAEREAFEVEQQKQRAAIEAEQQRQRDEAEAKAKAERERRFVLLMLIVNAKPEWCADELWPTARASNSVCSDDEINEPFASMPIAELESLKIEADRLRAEKRQREAEEAAIAEKERQVALAIRREALKPDCEKLRTLAETLRTVPIPDIQDPELWGSVNDVTDNLNRLAAILDSAADMIQGIKKPEVH